MEILFSNLSSVIRTLVIGPLIYIILIIFLRVSGKRTLAQLNAFDYIITVALGSSLATAVISKDVTLVDGALALLLLIILQLAIAWIGVRWKSFSLLVKSEPKLLFKQGQFIEKELKAERIRHDEILQAIRSQGIGSLEEVAAVVLETNGTLSIIRKTSHERDSTLKNVAGIFGNQKK